jgi:hypothetical protein
LGLGNEERTLKASRAYIAGVGTTGVLIASFFMLLTVGSTIVAFRGVPGAPSNGDLSSIELRHQRESAQRTGALLTSSDALGKAGSRDAAGSGDVLGRRASGVRGWPAGLIDDGVAGSAGPDALHPGVPRTPVGEKTPPGASPAPTPTNGVVATPVVPGTPAEDGSGTNSDSGSGSGSDSGSGSGSGSGTDTGTGSGSGTGSDSGSGTGSGTDTGSGSGSGSTGSDSSGSGSGSGSGGVGDTVEDVTDTVGSTVGTVSPGGGQAVSDAGGAVGGLLEDATSVVGGLTGGVAGTN